MNFLMNFLRKYWIWLLIAFGVIFIAFVVTHAQTPRQCSVGEVPSCTVPTNPPVSPPLPPSTATMDGPAELPRIYIKSNVSDTPSPGVIIHVKAGTENAAYAAAKCGDTLMLDPNSQWPQPSFTKNCDNAHWITIRPDVSDLLLPPEHSRLTPCYAGIASLSARPSYPCSSLVRVMPRFILTGNQHVTVSGSYHRFIGIENLQMPGTGLTRVFWQVTGSHIVFDRGWTHGGPTDEATHGFYLDGSSYVALIDSYNTDFHCKSPGLCSDAQVVSGISASGPYKITNNFLEASGEAVLFGGGISSIRPADIEVTRNHFFKSLIWNPGHPSYFGTQFTTKNHFELKDGQRVLFEGNIIENNWGGFSQSGFAILLTPKNLGAIVKDVTIRYSVIKGVSGAFQIANVAQSTTGIVSGGGLNYSIHDIIIDNSPPQYCYKCSGEFMQINGLTAEPLTNVSIKHITYAGPPATTSGGMMFMGPAVNVSIVDSIIDVGKYGPWSIGGTTNCAYNKNGPLTKLNACFVPYTVTGNVLPRGKACPYCFVAGVAQWPAGNFYPTDNAGVGYVNLVGGDYHLTSASPYKGKATDGKDPGADIDAVLKAIAGVL